MKEIKFRAWSKIANTFTYFGGKEPIIEFIKSHNAGMFLEAANDVYISSYEEPQQYIGLKDIEGKEIYEGDILEEDEGYYFEVVWDNKYAKFKLQWRTKAFQFPEWNRGIKMKIIGNIYENPELLSL